MGRLIVSEFVTLDGVMEAPGGEPTHPHSGWAGDFPDPGQLAYKLDETLAAEVLLIGRKTYEGFAEAWPNRTDGVGLADKMNRMPKYVVSSTLSELEWSNSALLDGEVPDSIARLKERVVGEILVAGSRTLVHSLIEEGLVDELRLMVFPVMLGSGDRVFPDTPRKVRFDLVGTRALDSGTLINTYRPSGADQRPERPVVPTEAGGGVDCGL